MSGKRSKDHHLPSRVYHVRGKHWYVDRAGKWHDLGKEWGRAAKEEYARLSEDQAPKGTVADMLVW